MDRLVERPGHHGLVPRARALAVLHIGLTGGIASGKSTVADLFVELGAGLVDTDAIAREVVEPGSRALDEIAASFGAEIIAADGTLDRRKMRTIVFADPAKRRRLEAIVHPLIRERALALAGTNPAPYVLLAVPLLIETGFAEIVDRVLVVDCPESLQIQRLMTRDGMSVDEATEMLAAQTDRDSRMKVADDCIDNSGDRATTKQQVEALHAQYLAMTHNC